MLDTNHRNTEVNKLVCLRKDERGFHCCAVQTLTAMCKEPRPARLLCEERTRWEIKIPLVIIIIFFFFLMITSPATGVQWVKQLFALVPVLFLFLLKYTAPRIDWKQVETTSSEWSWSCFVLHQSSYNWSQRGERFSKQSKCESSQNKEFCVVSLVLRGWELRNCQIGLLLFLC